MKKRKAVIFDWAGTTVDYGCFAPVQAFIEVFKEFDILPTLEETRKPMGMLKKDHLRTMLSMERISNLWKEKYKRAPEEKDVDAMYQKFESNMRNVLHQFADPKPFVVETVAQLRNQGIKIGSTTGYTDEMMEIVTKTAAQKGYAPDVWFSPDSVGQCGRPYPFMIFENLKALKIESVDQVIKVGDTISDIQEGKNAGVFTIYSGYCGRQFPYGIEPGRI